MDIQVIIKQVISKALTELSLPTEGIVLEHPADLSHGDYSTNIAMVLGKEAKMNPKELAEKIVDKLNLTPALSWKGEGGIQVAGPGFINFTLSKSFFAEEVKSIFSLGDQYGKNTKLVGQTWVIEHTSPNPNKAMHLGHLRNNLTGMAIANIAEANGVKVIRDEIDNNRGIAIAKLMWGYLKFGRNDKDETKTDLVYWSENENEWKTPESSETRPDRFVDAFYVIGADDFKNPEVESTVRGFVVRWEAGDVLIWKLWKKVLDYSYEGQQLTLSRLGNHWDNVWHEHEHYQKGKDLVDEGLKKGIFRIGDGGAIVTDFKDEKLSDTVLIKSDGTALYITQDIALTKLKRDTYNADKLFWVIGPEQSLALRQVFRVCSQLGIGKEEDYIHISYGYMSILKNGQIEKMSSREGNVIYIDDLIDMVKSVVASRFENENDILSEEIAIGAVKFAILFTGRSTDTAFDINRAANLEGDSGPYLQYTYARIQALLEKGKQVGFVSAYNNGNEEKTNLERVLYRYPETVEFALTELAPNYIATHLIEVAREFNSFYGNNKIVDENNKEISEHRLALARATQIILKNGLMLLGIKAPEKM